MLTGFKNSRVERCIREVDGARGWLDHHWETVLVILVEPVFIAHDGVILGLRANDD